MSEEKKDITVTIDIPKSRDIIFIKIASENELTDKSIENVLLSIVEKMRGNDASPTE